MNLTIDPWIPIVWRDGRSALASLKDIFGRGEEIADLAVRPHERIALMRLLLCIAQASLNGPEDEEDWKTCKARLAPSALAYLDKWKSALELFGDGPRFLQLQEPRRAQNAEKNTVFPASKLDLALAVGNNSTLLDNIGGSNRFFSPAQLALMLLTFQCFSPLFGSGYKGKGLCIEGNMLHTLIKKPTLCLTIHANILHRRLICRVFGETGEGKPYWELPWDIANYSDAVHNATETYLGRLIPLTRSVYLETNGLNIKVGNGLEYPAFREPTATVIAVQDETRRKTLACSIGKSTWRELHSLFVKRLDEKAKPGCPLALDNPLTDEGLDIWTGGLVTDGKAKIEDSIESVFNIPPGMLTEQGLMRYQDGVHQAEKVEKRLLKAVAVYANDLKEVSLGRREVAQKQFWTEVDQQAGTLLDTIRQPTNEQGWTKLISKAQFNVYCQTCPKDTPRQMLAYVKGLAVLDQSPKRKKRRP